MARRPRHQIKMVFFGNKKNRPPALSPDSVLYFAQCRIPARAIARYAKAYRGRGGAGAPVRAGVSIPPPIPFIIPAIKECKNGKIPHFWRDWKFRMAYLSFYECGICGAQSPYSGARGTGMCGKTFKSALSGWASSTSKARLRKKVMSIRLADLPEEAYWIMLSVGADWQKIDKVAIKKCMKMLFQWLERRGVSGIFWELEYQRRGAVHLHLLILGGGFGSCNRRDYIRGANRWDLGEDWRWQISENMKSKHGTRRILEKWLSFPAIEKTGAKMAGQFLAPLGYWKPRLDCGGLWSYLSTHHGKKSKQHTPPPGWEYAGRVWAFRGKWIFHPPLVLLVENEIYSKVGIRCGATGFAADGVFGFSRVVKLPLKMELMEYAVANQFQSCYTSV